MAVKNWLIPIACKNTAGTKSSLKYALADIKRNKYFATAAINTETKKLKEHILLKTEIKTKFDSQMNGKK